MLRKTFALALLLPLLACSSTVVPGDFPFTCRGLYDAFATWSSACDRPALDAASRDDLVARCQARAALPGIEVSPAALGACAAEVAASSCAALPVACLTLRDAEYPGLPTDVWLGDTSSGRYELFPRVAGMLAAGMGCDLDAQCQSARCSSAAAACGVCIDVNGPGEACGATAVCDEGSQCDGGVCVPWGDGLGAACQSAKGSSCARNLRCVDAICVPPHQAGASCAGDAFDACADSAVCHHGVCQTIVTVPAGEDCDDATRCEEGTYCDSGQCRGPELDVGLGGWCTIDLCSEGLVCNSLDKCVTGAPAGQACSYDVPCAAGLVCFEDPGSRVCGAPRAEGGACTSSTGCAGGLFCMPGSAGAAEGACRRELEAGEPCDSGPCRVSLACSGGVCVALGACSSP